MFSTVKKVVKKLISLIKASLKESNLENKLFKFEIYSLRMYRVKAQLKTVSTL